MPVIAPQTDVYLLKVPLEINDINQLDFTSREAQFNYFNSLPKYELTDFTYQRKDGIIRVPLVFDDLLSYNYVMYRNNEFSDKWFYAFIDGLEFKSPNSTDISIRTDTWQSWMFDISFKPTLIDREHTNDDTIGLHTLPEGLELGEFVTNGSVADFGLSDDGICTVVDVTMVENTGENQSLSYQWESGTHSTNPYVNGVASGVIHLIVGFFENPTTYRDPEELIDVYDFAGLGNAIVNVYPMPRRLIGTTSDVYKLSITATKTAGTGTSSLTVNNIAILKSTFSEKIDSTTWRFSKPQYVDSYEPVNKKLLTYPYCFFNISNNAGTAIPYHYEDFTTSTCNFRIASAFTPSGSVKAYPLDYKNLNGTTENSYDYGVTGAKFPIGNWVNDAYTNWLTQNAVNMKVQWTQNIFGGLIGTAQKGYEGYRLGKELTAQTEGKISYTGKLTGAGIAGGVAGMVGSLINTAIDQHMAKTQANLVADSAGGNINSGDIIWAKNRGSFTFMPMSIKAEYARCIDEFFSQFGYKCNRVKVPNIRGRRNWNYVKTVGCYISGDIPQTDMAEIKSMFDRGITIWHNPATFADYSQNNDII